MKLGIAGPPGSGKDTIAQYLVEVHNFSHVSTGDQLRQEADRLGLDHDRSTLQRLGHEIRQKYGYDFLFVTALQQAIGRVVFTGIRTVSAAQVLEQNGGVLVYVDAPIDVRYERCESRARETPLTFERFLELDHMEHEGGDNLDLSLDRIRPLARFTIINSAEIDQLHFAIDSIISELET